ncbi:MAG: zinc metalloprotease HtpX [Candidatus Bathyarchaeia archaeon]
MGLIRLRLTMLGTVALIVAVSTLFFTVLLSSVGASLLFIVPIIIIFNILQWLFAPKMINAMYRVEEIPRSRNPLLHETVEELSRKVGIKKPKLMMANISVPNAFAYGSPLTGNMVAVTRGLLDTLEYEEVEAVLGHEIGHLKHRDVQVMMFVSVLPAIFYYIAYSMMLSAWLGGYSGRRNGVGGAMLIGLVAMAFYWILSLTVLGLSRQREYYADRRSVMIVEDGARKLSEGLAKIVTYTGRMKLRSHQEVGRFNAFRTLFIADPERSDHDSAALLRSRGATSDQMLVSELLSRKVTTADRVLELFTTHPNIVKRLRVLEQLRRA